MVWQRDDALLQVGLGNVEGSEMLYGIIDMHSTFAHQVCRKRKAALEQGQPGKTQACSAMALRVAGEWHAIDPVAGTAQHSAVGAVDHNSQVGGWQGRIGGKFEFDTQLAFAAAHRE